MCSLFSEWVSCTGNRQLRIWWRSILIRRSQGLWWLAIIREMRWGTAFSCVWFSSCWDLGVLQSFADFGHDKNRGSGSKQPQAFDLASICVLVRDIKAFVFVKRECNKVLLADQCPCGNRCEDGACTPSGQAVWRGDAPTFVLRQSCPARSVMEFLSGSKKKKKPYPSTKCFHTTYCVFA